MTLVEDSLLTPFQCIPPAGLGEERWHALRAIQWAKARSEALETESGFAGSETSAG